MTRMDTDKEQTMTNRIKKDVASGIETRAEAEALAAEIAALQIRERQAKAAERFKHADSDGDGKISRAEAVKNAPRLAKKFDAIDANKDGQLTRDELRAYRETKRSQKNKV